MRLAAESPLLRAWPLLLAITAGTAAAQEPVFRSSVALGTIDVMVVDRNGVPVSGLTAADFVVRVVGKPREVRTIATFGVDSTSPAASAREGARETITNTTVGDPLAPRRVLLLLFDDLAFGGLEGRQLLEAAARFVNNRPVGDRVGVFSMSGMGPQVAPTSDRPSVERALGRYVGQRPRHSGETDEVNLSIAESIAIADGNEAAFKEAVFRECLKRPDDDEEGTDLSFQYCMAQVQHVAGTKARDARHRTTLQVARVLSILEASGSIKGGTQLVLLTRGIADHGGDVPIDALERAAAAHNVTIIGFHQPALSADVFDRRPSVAAVADRALERQGLEALVDATGGRVVTVAGSADSQFVTLGRQLDALYRLGFFLEPGDQRDGNVRVQVTTNRRGLRLLPAVRTMSFASPVTAEAVARRTPEKKLEDLLASLAPASSIPISVRAFVARDQRGRGLKLTVAAMAETGEAVRAAFSLQLGSATVASGMTPELVDPEGASVPLGFTAVVPPGDYVLRLAVLSATESAGTVAYPFRARLTQAGDLVLSDPLVWAGDAGTPAYAPEAVLVTNDGIHTRIEAYPRGSAAVEGHELVLALSNDDGKPITIKRIPLAVGVEGTLAQTWLSVDGIPSGDYVFKTEILREGRLEVSLERRVRLEKPPAASVAPAAAPDGHRPGAPAASPRFDAATWLGEGGFDAIATAFKRAGRALPLDVRTVLSGAPRNAQAPGEESDLLLRVVRALRDGELDLAAVSMASLTREMKSSPVVLVLTGAVYAARGHDREAAAAWSTADAAGFGDPIFAIATIDALRRAGAHDDADAILADALTRWPSHPGVRARAMK